MKNQDLLVILDERITEIARAIVQEAIANGIAPVQPSDDRSVKLREQLSFIKAKEHVTVKEAALLLSCSESHIRKLVMLARKGQDSPPRSFCGYGGRHDIPARIPSGLGQAHTAFAGCQK